MKTRRSRLALVGVLALALCVTVGLAAGSVADAKKGKKKKGGKGAASVTIATTTPTTLPPSTAAQPVNCGLPPITPVCTVPGKISLTSVPLTVGKKAKGKVVSLDSVSVTYTLTGSARTGAGTVDDMPGSASEVEICLTAPNGRTTCANNPGAGDPNATTIGPVTVTPDSPLGVCPLTLTGTNGTQTICGGSSFNPEDPERTVGPPNYAGTIGDNSLVDLGGVPAQGTWTFKLRNRSTTMPAVLSNISATIGLAPSPTSSSTGGGKKKK